MADMQLYLGLDLGSEYTQLSFYNVDTREPESVYHKEAKDTYMLPNLMFYSAYHKRMSETQNECYRFIDLSGWCAGAKASAYRFEENGTIVDQLYERTQRHETLEVAGKTYKAGELLVKMMVLHIKQFTDQFDGFVIKKLTVTVADTDPRIIDAVRNLRSALRLTREQFNIVSHLDSCLCYIFAQPEPLRNNSVGLFDFGRDGLDFYRIDMTRKYPLIVTVEHQSYHDRINLKRFGRYHEDMDEAFADVVRECMSQIFVSSVFLTGVGFVDNWMKQSAKILCQGRRVFVGQNIYTKGACYRSLGGVYTESLSRYFIDTEQTVKTNIGINLMDGKNTFWPIVYGGLEWFNTRGGIEVFLDDTRRIQIVYQDIITEQEWRETIEIYGLPARPKKTTKLSIEVEYYGADKGAIVIRDLGFGSLYPSTNKIYRKEFDIGAIRKKHEKKLEEARRAEELRIRMGDTEELKGEDPDVSGDVSVAETYQGADDIPEAEIVDVNKEEPVVYYGTASPVASGDIVDETSGGEQSEKMGPDESEMISEEYDSCETDEEVESDDRHEADEKPEPDDRHEADGEVDPDESYETDEDPDEEDIYEPDEESETDDGHELDVEPESHDGCKDDEKETPGDDFEEEQSAFSIPSYLRGQHFDPGE